MCNWDKQLNASQEVGHKSNMEADLESNLILQTSRIQDESKLPVAWLAGNTGIIWIY